VKSPSHSGLDELILEMQNRFDQLEITAESLFLEDQVDSDFLDQGAVLSSVDSLILQSQVPEHLTVLIQPGCR
jgi:P2-related tail formation protein